MPKLQQVKPQEKQVRPFSNGSQYGDWRMRNCDHCAKSWDNMKPQSDDGKGPCEIDNAIGTAYIGSGSVDESIGKRMGYENPLYYSWECPEREETK